MNIFNFLRPKPKLFVAFNEGQGSPVIFIHGIASDSSCWGFVKNQLSSNSQLQLIGLDLLGFGNSPKPKNNNYSLEEHAKAIERTLKTLKISAPLTIVGHSLGGLIAIKLANRQKIAIEKLILCAPPIYLKEDINLTTKKYDRTARAKNNAYFNLFKAIARRPNMSLKVARLIANRFSDFTLNEATWTPFKKSLINSINDQTSFNELVKLNLRIHLIYGRLDVFLVQLHFKEAAQLNNKIKLISFNGGHSLTKKFSQAIAKDLTTSFRKQSEHL